MISITLLLKAAQEHPYFIYQTFALPEIAFSRPALPTTR